MRKAILLFILLFQVAILQAQEVNFVEDYYPFIRKAEIAITQLSFGEASNYYKQAFKAVEQPFAIDYYNAALCAIQNKNYREATRYSGLLIDKGMDSRFFNRQAFSSIKKEKVWKKLMQTYPKRRKAYLSRINISLRNEILSLNEKDQHFRRMPGSYGVHGDTIFGIDMANVKRIREIISQYGYPDENLVGLVDNNFHSSLPSIIILHHYQQGYYDLSATLLEQVKMGKLSPREFVQYEEQLLQHKYKSNLFTKLDTTIVVEHKFKIADLTTSDQVRKDVGLETIEEWRRKILFEMNNVLLLPWERYKNYQNEGFNFQSGYGIFGFIGDGAFNRKFIERIPPEAIHILDNAELEKESIKKVFW
ncbi:hypothetical protein GXP67_33055 [Rhodocytophaga rosea]|uniref:Tetratricopeptide repeat protein n=1 Tax=Rhodocytophaga rosea TaxID=2704465 RepID=A0A6C0GUX5_9BACT|nr:hypothetical protein [Rhodocytophaga rosea]QHT71140.1 hypothetical protein GXP67_33055 [Rhodocytophaga rosea]